MEKYDYGEIPPHGTLSFPINVQGDLLWHPPKADTYTLTAVLPLKDGRKIRDVSTFVVKPVPGLRNPRHLRFQRGTQAVHDFVGADLGFAQTGKRKERDLYCVVRQSELGKTKLRQPPERTFRLMHADPKADFETMVYNPFPLFDEPIIEVHVLVTEPNKPQRYFVIDLSLGATLKKNQTLKSGTVYRLDNKRLGTVELVPIKKK